MNKIVLLSVMFFLTSPAIAQSAKHKHCPKLNQLDMMPISDYRYYFYSYNDDGRYFVSKKYKSDKNNGPAFPVAFNESNYEPASKTLSCIYIAFASGDGSSPTLVNTGDY